MIPPLKGADYLLENLDRTACNIRYGLQGEIIVNGVDYNQPMPGNDKLTALEIAEIITYAANSWGNEAGLYSVKETEKALKACAEN